MPELPEVERAARTLDAATRGKTIARVRVLHASLARRFGERDAAHVRGRVVARVERRGKHQLLWLDDGAAILAHFRMTGDWEVGRTSDATLRFARAEIDFGDGTRVSFVDPRALGTLTYLEPGNEPALALGPDASDAAFTAKALAASLARKRSAIKPALLDQRVVAGLGNIYAAEALWRARIDPRAPASSLTPQQCTRLRTGIRDVLARAARRPGRYAESAGARLDVYDREGEPCRRCGTPIDRIVQAGRSTYFCPRCQRA